MIMVPTNSNFVDPSFKPFKTNPFLRKAEQEKVVPGETKNGSWDAAPICQLLSQLKASDDWKTAMFSEKQ